MRHIVSTFPLRIVVASAVLVTLVPAGQASAATPGTRLDRWTSTSDFAKGTSSGISAGSGSITIGAGARSLSYDDPRVAGGTKKYDRGMWVSPWRTTGFSAKTLIPSWSVKTPAGTWARIDVRVRTKTRVGSWDSVARYALGSSSIQRSSYTSQADDLAKLSTDTIVANAGKSFTSWQVRVLLLRPAGTTARPTLYAVNGVSAAYLTRSASTSRTTMTRKTELAVPRSSQMIHRGEFPQWGGGGEAWCSPTSTSMVMRYFKAGPRSSDYRWSPYADSFVDHAARYTFDHGYDGAGNWPFNTAYAAGYSLDTFVTRLSSLRDAEQFIKAGIPLVASVAFKKGGLTGAPISSTPGHLMVITGFARSGKVIVNDPAAASSSTVRRVYSRSQFEKAWLGGSGGVVYVIRPTRTKLPKDTARW